MHVTAVINGHREGLLAGASILSFREAVEHARSAGLHVETLIILDRPDTVTTAIFNENPVGPREIVLTEYGDLGLARNRAVEEATGEFVGFLDADDLWSVNWLTAAYNYSRSQSKPFVAHSEFNVVFGSARNFWMHVDSEATDFDPGHLGIGNYWDSMSFAPRDLYLAHPFERASFGEGFGYEDWHWNCETLLAGIAHRPVPDTMHFKRRRANSLLSMCAEKDVVPWPTDIVRYETVERMKRESRT
ncbi:glycosyltransferase [Agrobacterium vitis]|uniref:glycosyltransferase family A protein n=1 Tax=Agrobacterium vitis TaxID=373 RepID=UPI0012E95A1B|nr:glycosyltransferase family 2 protein [Agrobacterium vitis]MCF1467877.1 glycosyltransferase family 2 protein [Agrobacterium vitis]MVA80243.1 glycosyltransferase [Agrobacterium vitis]